jgi:hypothetical protein
MQLATALDLDRPAAGDPQPPGPVPQPPQPPAPPGPVPQPPAPPTPVPQPPPQPDEPPVPTAAAALLASARSVATRIAASAAEHRW